MTRDLRARDRRLETLALTDETTLAGFEPWLCALCAYMILLAEPGPHASPRAGLFMLTQIARAAR